MRPVKLLEAYRPEGHVGYPLPERIVGVGMFHEWGMEFEEFEAGVGNYSIAIIEMPDGTVKNWPSNMIQFDDAE